MSCRNAYLEHYVLGYGSFDGPLALLKHSTALLQADSEIKYVEISQNLRAYVLDTYSYVY